DLGQAEHLGIGALFVLREEVEQLLGPVALARRIVGLLRQLDRRVALDLDVELRLQRLLDGGEQIVGEAAQRDQDHRRTNLRLRGRRLAELTRGFSNLHPLALRHLARRYIRRRPALRRAPAPDQQTKNQRDAPHSNHHTSGANESGRGVKIGRRSQTKTPTGGHHMRSKSTSPKERAKRASASRGGRGGKEEASEASEGGRGGRNGGRNGTKTPHRGAPHADEVHEPQRAREASERVPRGPRGQRRSERSERARPRGQNRPPKPNEDPPPGVTTCGRSPRAPKSERSERARPEVAAGAKKKRARPELAAGAKIGRRSQTKTPTGGHPKRSKSTSPKERAKRASASQGGRGGKEEESEASKGARGR